MTRHRLGVSAVALFATTLLLTACGGGGDEGDSEGSLEVTTSQTPVAQAQQVEPKVADRLSDTTTDPGLNVDWTYQGVRSGQTGGSVVTVLLHNLNEEPLAPADIPAPTLRYNSGGGTMVDATPVSDEDAAMSLGLDLPLGAGASTNIRYAFQVNPGNLWDAELKVGNVIFDGNLSY